MSNLANFQELEVKIKDKVKTTFFDLLPDDKFTELVNKEITAFFEATTTEFTLKGNLKNAYYNNSNVKYDLVTPISPFRAIIWAECRKIVDKILDDMFTNDGLYTMATNKFDISGMAQQEISDKLKVMLKEEANNLATSFFTNMFAQAFGSVKFQLTNDIKNDIRNNF